MPRTVNITALSGYLRTAIVAERYDQFEIAAVAYYAAYCESVFIRSREMFYQDYLRCANRAWVKMFEQRRESRNVSAFEKQRRIHHHR